MKKLSPKLYTKLVSKSQKEVEKDPYLRIGQTIFNNYHDINPKHANNISGSEADPFYAYHLTDPRVKKFIEEIVEKPSKKKFGIPSMHQKYELRLRNKQKIITDQTKLLATRKAYITKCSNFVESLLNEGRVTKEELKEIFKKKNS